MKILFYGDSIMFGQGVTTIDSWISIISQELKNRYSNHQIIVENISVNGRTSREALIDFPRFVQNSKADIVFFQFGLNDLNYWQTDNGIQRVNINSFYYNLEEMVFRSKANGIRTIVLLTNHPVNKIIRVNDKNITLEEQNIRYNDKIRSSQNVHDNVFVIDIHSKIASLQINDYLSIDGIHLTKNGNQIYSKIVMDFISTNL
jgi:lysophospholipase L1-like esterase